MKNVSFVNAMIQGIRGTQDELEQMQQQLNKSNSKTPVKNIGETGMIMDGVSMTPEIDAEKQKTLDDKITSKVIVKNNKKLTLYKVNTEPRPNDLCPCGSGKKYKKCCKNKGIYGTKYKYI